jgi:hypothetical protein
MKFNYENRRSVSSYVLCARSHAIAFSIMEALTFYGGWISKAVRKSENNFSLCYASLACWLISYKVVIICSHYYMTLLDPMSSRHFRDLTISGRYQHLAELKSPRNTCCHHIYNNNIIILLLRKATTCVAILQSGKAACPITGSDRLFPVLVKSLAVLAITDSQVSKCRNSLR